MRFYSITRLLALPALAFAASRTSPPSGSLTVGSGYTYSTVQKAVDALSTSTSSDQIIFIYPGTYSEQVYIPSLSGTLYVYGYTSDTSSYSSNEVTIEYGSSIAGGADDDDATGTVRNWSDNTYFYNINIKNTYGSGSQALALSAYGSYQGYYGVGLYGYQDTLLSETGYQVYAQSYIQGADDFIFGQHAVTWFEQCDIGVSGAGAITANGRSSSSDPSYYVFNDCTVAAASGYSVSSGVSYLGRPWSEYARVCFQKCSLSSVINSAGWEVWSSSEPNTEYVTFEEYDNSGSGASGTRASFATTLSSALTISGILGSDYADWVDTSYI